ncbi:MAG: hypothetical protein B6243_08890 [Anaerolineaceae bacterium 4572_5.2]|nr:MAG: hypothetical protein B6243_08890 [Anaerolineaceae bacterium 4572_5.2]
MVFSGDGAAGGEGTMGVGGAFSLTCILSGAEGGGATLNGGGACLRGSGPKSGKFSSAMVCAVTTAASAAATAEGAGGV